MAQKRMFSKHITDSEEFLEMPVSSQLLYFHLNMNADDDGFVQPDRIIRMTGCANKDDLKVLHAKGFILPVADRVIVIRHWHVNNTLRKDRYSPSIYKEHLKALGLDDNKIYNKIGGLPNGNQKATQYSIGKVSIVKDSVDKKKKVYIQYGEFNNVKLIEEEHNKLIEKYGNDTTKTYIEKLSLYIEQKGNKYKSHYATILTWIRRDVEENKLKVAEKKPSTDKLLECSRCKKKTYHRYMVFKYWCKVCEKEYRK
jgi:hypothetical protein